MEKTIPASEAFERLKANPLNHLPLALVYRIEVEEASFGYYARAATDRQSYLQSVYIFSGWAHAKLPDKREVKVPYEQYVLALEEPLESIWPDSRGFKAEPRKDRRARGKMWDRDEKRK
jgi:hypothetical protein